MSNTDNEVKPIVKKQSLIVTIVNKGSTDLVMNAARKAGGKGGTITIARGTGNPDLAKFYGLAIQPEKEMVFIVVDDTIKDKVMKQIYDEAGISTQGQGISFSVPITDAIGLNPLNEDQDQKAQ
ncbi:MAG: P-II family nitrogen regulator [Bacilli bacterium]